MTKGVKPSDMVGEVDDGDPKEPYTVVADSTGLSVTNKGSYIEEMWRKEKRRFIKLHILADKKGKIVEFRITSEKTGDSKKFVPLVKEASRKRKISRVYADVAYDTKRDFNVLEELGIEPAINSGSRRCC